MKKTPTIIVSAVFLFLFTVSYGQGWQVSPGTNTIVETGTTLYLDAGGSVLLQDDLTYSPSLVEKGSVVYNGGGDLKVQQYFEKNEWHIISSPVSNEVIGAYMDIYLYSYDEPTDAFTNLYQPVTIPLNVGEGYHVWSVASSPDYVTLNGTSNKTDVNRTLTVTDATNHSGWNLLGNPFPCAVDWNGDADWNINNVAATIYLFDAGAGNYKTWTYPSGPGTNGKTDGLIAATQGFWVRTSDTIGSQPSYSLTIPASQRVASATTEFYKQSESWDNLLRVKVESETYSDECIIAFNAEATDNFDNNFDAYKLFTEVPSPKLYTMAGNEKIAVNFMNSVEQHKDVPLYFKSGLDGTFTITAIGMDSFPAETGIYLEDEKDNVTIDLKEVNEYSFTSTPLDSPDRFVIHFGVNTGIDTPVSGLMDAIHIYSREQSVIVDIPFKFKGMGIIYDLIGEKVAEKDMYEGKNEIELNDPSGYYIVKVFGNESVKTQKVYIR